MAALSILIIMTAIVHFKFHTEMTFPFSVKYRFRFIAVLTNCMALLIVAFKTIIKIIIIISIAIANNTITAFTSGVVFVVTALAQEMAIITYRIISID